MRKTVDINGIKVDNVTMDAALQILVGFINSNGCHTVYTPNAEIMMAAHRDKHLKRILNDADMLVADGAGVVLASKILGTPVAAKVPGFDMTKNSFTMAYSRKIRYFFFGGKPGVAEEASKKVTEAYSNVEIVGYRDGYFNESNTQEIINIINSSEADILLVALGAPKQEKWIYDHKAELNVKICIGVGGTLDVLAGKVALAPAFFRDNGLEWLYRLYKEPRRFKRMLDLPKFILLILKKRIQRP